MTREQLKQQGLNALAQVFDGDAFRTDAQTLQHYGQDWSRIYKADPLVVVFPTETAQVQQLMSMVYT